jgi:hypothetical protein
MLSNVSERGPWEVVGSGDEKRLKLHYRRALDRDGYCVVDDKCSLFDRRSSLVAGVVDAYRAVARHDCARRFRPRSITQRDF